MVDARADRGLSESWVVAEIFRCPPDALVLAILSASSGFAVSAVVSVDGSLADGDVERGCIPAFGVTRFAGSSANSVDSFGRELLRRRRCCEGAEGFLGS